MKKKFLVIFRYATFDDVCISVDAENEIEALKTRPDNLSYSFVEVHYIGPRYVCKERKIVEMPNEIGRAVASSSEIANDLVRKLNATTKNKSKRVIPFYSSIKSQIEDIKGT
jgi:hypothetical protein